MAKRRSIIEFEQWLDGQIATVKTEIDGLQRQQAAGAQRMAEAGIRLSTLLGVSERLQEAPVDDDALPPGVSESGPAWPIVRGND